MALGTGGTENPAAEMRLIEVKLAALTPTYLREKGKNH